MIKVCSLLILSILICQMILVNMYSNTGNEVSQLKNYKYSLNLEINNLRSSLVEKSSLTRLYKQAHDLGLVNIKVAFEKTPAPVARSYGNLSD